MKLLFRLINFSVLSFVSIGAETSIRGFGKIGRAPAIAFTVAQTFNVIWTLVISYILFSAMG